MSAVKVGLGFGLVCALLVGFVSLGTAKTQVVSQLSGGNFAIAESLSQEFNGTIERLLNGDFDENSAHFWEKSPERQKAMIVSLVAFLGLSDNLLCEQKLIMSNPTQNKLAVVCDIRDQNLASRRYKFFDVGIMIFGLDNPTPFLITIIPSGWDYVCTMSTTGGYQVVVNSGPPPCFSN